MTDSKRDNERKEGPELKPDGWAQFERAVDAAVKGGPKHKIGKHKAKAKIAQTAKSERSK